jgi:hypothetical protein
MRAVFYNNGFMKIYVIMSTHSKSALEYSLFELYKSLLNALEGYIQWLHAFSVVTRYAYEDIKSAEGKF